MSLPHPTSTGGGDPPHAAGSADRVERLPRTNLFLTAQLTLPGEPPRAVRVRKLSASGARVETADPPQSGTTLLLRRGAAQVAAEVMWRAQGRCGLRFSQPIDVARWMSDRPGTVAAAVSHEPSLADDLALARQLVDRLEDALATEPAIVALLGTELQAIDLLGQLLRTSEKRAAGSTAPAIRSLWQAAATFLRQPPFRSSQD